MFNFVRSKKKRVDQRKVFSEEYKQKGQFET